ncbi:cold shock small protein YmcF [Kluyvera intermedia]|uniref:cold shock small protein YmcF n=1 Tax=Kluyvera intermedia TaxID=61648 RepID=UPI00243214B2|nr:hypothetical protein [Kluyvera intermedia]WEJ86518.1 MAG: hypothetical protein P0Y47_01335 [Kluyvera intermedia]
MILINYFRCPCCHGSQYRTSIFDVSEKNPSGAKCIFCKSIMSFDGANTIKENTLAPQPN